MSTWSSSQPCFVSGSCCDKIRDLHLSTTFSYLTHLEYFADFKQVWKSVEVSKKRFLAGLMKNWPE